VAEPYASAPTSAFLLHNASDIIVRKLPDSTGQPVRGLGERGRILGYPSYLHPFMPAMANTAESIAFGGMSKYFVRIVHGVRFEGSDEFRFQNDLVAFRCILRLDGALVGTGAVKTFVHTTLAAAVWPFRRKREDRALFMTGPARSGSASQMHVGDESVGKPDIGCGRFVTRGDTH
jgi:hypothetical protein